jgi:hypothetical protein
MVTVAGTECCRCRCSCSQCGTAAKQEQQVHVSDAARVRSHIQEEFAMATTSPPPPPPPPPLLLLLLLRLSPFFVQQMKQRLAAKLGLDLPHGPTGPATRRCDHVPPTPAVPPGGHRPSEPACDLGERACRNFRIARGQQCDPAKRAGSKRCNKCRARPHIASTTTVWWFPEQ